MVGGRKMKTPHDKLLEMGFRQSQNTLVNNTLYTIYEIDGGSITIIEGKENFYKTKMKLNLKLSRILTDYLEWLEEQK